MLTSTDKFPYFELLEIVAEFDLSYKPYQPLKPLKAGNFITGLTLKTDQLRWQRFYGGAETFGPVVLRQLLNKPLVISFYSRHWKGNGLGQLTRLNDLQNEIKASGGNLLIINAGNDEDLAKTAWENDLSLNFYFDENHEIAELFGVYSENYPVWNRFSGIDVNVPLLATYVIDQFKQVVYADVDMDLTGSFSANGIIAAVYESALLRNNKKSA
ncbi:redoxin domain-containing protein [Mucilaginibacter gotjawali]|uniref:Thioredoxin-dependent thiol peroxidase n=2 Tax=Mucilaginibacter gotjawali TaxID=1550579 RepID=A0A120MYV8_9SPHI|nr:redoxin domain-containing protein [Mucilaginibacter gotjawali]MBB3053914.1 peroxiredoxin [Mucilaginibacter gotjawali]BAU54178.1 thioredoxin-dependent thiol peroxidase [Mucilaginibacter gotjawali]